MAETRQGILNEALLICRLAEMENISDRTCQVAAGAISTPMAERRSAQSADAKKLNKRLERALAFRLSRRTRDTNDPRTKTGIRDTLVRILPEITPELNEIHPMSLEELGACCVILSLALHSPDLTNEDLTTLSDLLETCMNQAPLQGDDAEQYVGALRTIIAQLREGDRQALFELNRWGSIMEFHDWVTAAAKEGDPPETLEHRSPTQWVRATTHRLRFLAPGSTDTAAHDRRDR